MTHSNNLSAKYILANNIVHNKLSFKKTFFFYKIKFCYNKISAKIKKLIFNRIF